jgi:signal transduction histidine kinase
MRDDSFVQARIFIVDDESANVRILERLLQQEGFVNLVLMTDAREFAAHYEAAPPDLVLLDLLMPHVSGFEVLAWLAGRTETPVRPPALVLTADATRDARERALAGGAMDFLTKPFDHLEVLLRVRNLLTRHFLELDLWEHNRVLESRVAERTRELQESLDLLRETSRQRQDLARRLLTAQEEERRWIAADVHDGPVQTLVALGIRLELLARRLADPEERAEMERIRATLADALTGLRTLMVELRPVALDRDGLEAALREHHARMEANGGPAVALVADLRSEPPAEAQAILFRIAQEALANVHKHAAASQVTVTLADDGEGARLSVRDDGRGFDPERAVAPGHLGLATMQDRATMAGGWCRVESAPGAGATVTAWVPVTPAEPGSTG